MSSLSISHLRFEHHPTGLGVGPAPRLSWRYEGGAENWTQTAYEVEVKRFYIKGAGQTRSYVVKGRSNALVPWPDLALFPREKAQVRVKALGTSVTARGREDVATDWTEWAAVEAGLNGKEEWKAEVIGTAIAGAERDTQGKGIRPVRLRKTFDAPVCGAARLYISALGLYEAYLNGVRVGEDHMAPGWTSYGSRIQYQVYDVADLIRPNQPNVLAVEIAEGWYAGRISWGDGYRCFFGDKMGVLAQLEICEGVYTTEPSLCVVSDASWQTSLSPLTSSEIYDGEVYDMRREDPGWLDVGFPAAGWHAAKVLPFPEAELVASPVAGVKVTQRVRPVKVFQSPSGRTIVDFGQNLVGRLCIHRVRKAPGHELRIRHAEVLEHGELAMRPLRRAKATDMVIFGETGVLANWSVHFTFHGFRYVDFDGWSAADGVDPVTLDAVSALVMHTDMERTGHFECDNELVNRLHQNVVWSMRSNFFSIPTDCPQRDERLGWTGDIQVFSPTASFLYDCAGMLSNWMKDVIADQKATDGVVPFVVPNVLINSVFPTAAQAVWDDVVILLPWVLYNWFGDVEVLRQSYDGMKEYLDNVLPRTDDGLWDPSVWQLGDWLDPNAPPSEPGLARTDGTLVADEYLVHVTDVIAKIATILEHAADAERYTAAAKRLRLAFNAKYVALSGLVVGDSQTALALALAFALHGLDPDLAPASDPGGVVAKQRAAAGARLARLVRYAKFRVSTGFAGTPAVLHALSATGHLQLAYRMLLERECPSWLYVVGMGGTTVWERWDSMLPDGTVNPGEMTSFNHYALGAVADWLHAVVGGLRPLAPAWTRFAVEPRPGGDLRRAKVEFVAPAGSVRCAWEIVDGEDEGDEETFKLALTVPPNTTAVVVLPHGGDASARREETVGSGEYAFESAYVPEGPWPPKPVVPFE